MSVLYRLLSSGGVRLLLVLTAAYSSGLAADAYQKISQRLQQQGWEVDRVSFVEELGLYQVVLRGDSGRLFFNAEADRFVYGDMFALGPEGVQNLSEVEREGDRARVLNGYARANSEQLISFAGEQRDHSVFIFTDIDCGFCRQLHQRMSEYNQLGIVVNYLAFPRSGPGSESFRKAISVWCNADQLAAMTAAKAGRVVAPAQCQNQQVLQQYELGQELGVRGTPAIVTQSGELIAGYLPPESLLARLQPGN